jgi:L,D-peptidoglycan transpeptidase YkuD (ErfK/YbiS/YcfS/YnhG family)
MAALAGLAVLLLGLGALTARAATRAAAGAASRFTRFAIPPGADQLIVVSSPTADPPPPAYAATLRAYDRANAGSAWQEVVGPWQAETGYGHLVSPAVRREGDGATPIGVFGVGATIYGNQPKPTGLHYAYHRLVCGDWWDEDPYSPSYNEFVHVACGVTPAFASWSEPLWTETVAYPYLVVIRFNMNPVHGGAHAPGSGIFLHSWVGGATAGCVAIHESQLLEIVRWLKPSAHPIIAIGTTGQVNLGPETG